MKKLITILIVIFYCATYAQVEKKYYLNKKVIKETGNLKDGLKDGLWEEFYENGKVKTSGNYLVGEKTGKWKIYYDNGVLAGEGEYLSTKFPKQGSWKFYFENSDKQNYKCKLLNPDAVIELCLDLHKRIEIKNPTGVNLFIHIKRNYGHFLVQSQKLTF